MRSTMLSIGFIGHFKLEVCCFLIIFFNCIGLSYNLSNRVTLRNVKNKVIKPILYRTNFTPYHKNSAGDPNTKLPVSHFAILSAFSFTLSTSPFLFNCLPGLRLPSVCRIYVLGAHDAKSCKAPAPPLTMETLNTKTKSFKTVKRMAEMSLFKEHQNSPVSAGFAAKPKSMMLTSVNPQK